MRPLLAALLFCGLAHAGEDGTVREVKALSPERCLAEAPEEIATRCPNIAGRHMLVDGKPVALLDRLDHKATYWCDKDGASWRCRRIVVLGRDLRTARTRNTTAFVTVNELVKALATAPTVKLGEEFGALGQPGEFPKTCLDAQTHGCAVQAVRLKAHTGSSTPAVRRRIWFLEDADGPMLACSDQQLTHCDELTTAGWQVLALTLRPSSLAGAPPAPEMDVPEVRADKRGAPAVVGGNEAQETPAGALDPWLKQKAEVHLPKQPTHADVGKVQHFLTTSGKSCLTNEKPRADVELLVSGEGTLVGIIVDGETPGSPMINCFTYAAKKIPLPHFDGPPFRIHTTISPPTSARSRSR